MYDEIIKLYKDAKNPDDARAMSQYMRNKFQFLGLRSPSRKALSKDFLKVSRKENLNWDFIFRLWNEDMREFQYLAIDYLKLHKKELTFDDTAKLRELITNKSWWDTIDGLDRLFGYMALSDIKIKNLMLEWSKADNIWLRRIAIDHQLGLKQQTDTILLEKIIKNNLGFDEFFINKSIGWALRDYSKVDPTWVSNFINKYKQKLSKLSIREGSKYI